MRKFRLELGDESWGIAVPCNIRDEKNVAVALETTVIALGPVIGYFTNAAIGGSRKFVTDSSADDWQPVLRINAEVCC